MLPRFAADYRTLAWVCLAGAVVALQYANPDWVIYLAPVSCYFALACGTIAHNHNHCPTFRNRRVNNGFANILSVFYGYPTFAWIPTHNLNHHKYVNARGDATITWRYSNRHNVFIAATYFFVSAYFQSGPINAFIRKARESKPALFRRIITQYAFWAGSHISLAVLAVTLHGPATGLKVYAFSLFVPAVFSLWTIMLFNYEQHVHTDPFSKYDHSRSFSGRLLNFLLFNNGLHYVHHEHPGTHWSKLYELNAEVADKIHPSLQLRSLWWYWLRQYVLAPFVPSLGTVQLGVGPWHSPNVSEDVLEREAGQGDTGDNAERLELVPQAVDSERDSEALKLAASA